jgi:hypothetical protein
MHRRLPYVLASVFLVGALLAGGLLFADRFEGATRSPSTNSGGARSGDAVTSAHDTDAAHLALASRVVHAHVASRQFRLALAVLAAGIVFLARPRRRSFPNGAETAAGRRSSGSRPGRDPPVIRVA